MPSWADALPRFPLLDGPSPLQRMVRFSETIGGKADLWIKREDLLPLAFGGNKLRNLEVYVGMAVAAGADSLVTSGRRWSNHCRLTAAAGAKAGLRVHLVLSGPPGPPGPNERLDDLLGAAVHVTSSGDRAARETAVEDLVTGLRERGGRPYVIPVGGAGVDGALGQVLAGMELADQARSAGLRLDGVILPSATGGTQAGLIVGLRLARLDAQVLGVAVAHPPDELRPSVARLLGALASRTGAVVDPAQIELDGTQLGAGYGVPTAEADDATRLLAQTEGILVDPIYTAKALAALVAITRSGVLDGRSVVFWHAGGTPALFGRDVSATSATRPGA